MLFLFAFSSFSVFPSVFWDVPAPDSFIMGKPRGIRTARKHVKNRRAQVWADLDYKKAHLGTRWKANPFGGASMAKGIVLEKVRKVLGTAGKLHFRAGTGSGPAPI